MDLPAEECVLQLIQQKARSFCPPVPEVRTERRRRRVEGIGRGGGRPVPAARVRGSGGKFLGLFELQRQLRFFGEQQRGNVTLK